MALEEKVLGFDYRQSMATTGQAWDAERRRTYLLKTETAHPLSVDTTVWPSVLEEKHSEFPEWTGMNQWLWENLETLRDWASRHGIFGSPGAPPAGHGSLVEIAVTWLSDESFPDRNGFGPFVYEGIAPAEVDPAWRFLGYDIADFGHISGLMNCGYREEKLMTLRPEWTPWLNSWHLFDDPAKALEFRKMTDERVSEHAPFEVMGIYVIRQVEGAGREG